MMKVQVFLQVDPKSGTNPWLPGSVPKIALSTTKYRVSFKTHVSYRKSTLKVSESVLVLLDCKANSPDSHNLSGIFNSQKSFTNYSEPSISNSALHPNAAARKLNVA